MAETHDRWLAGVAYEGFMGRWSRQLARRFVSWLGLPRGLHWLDVGCGTGALTTAICDLADPASVLGCDPASPFIEHAKQFSGHQRASFVAAGIDSLPLRADGYDSVSSLLALNFFPDYAVAVHQMQSVCRSGGTISCCVWDYSGKMDFLRRFWDAAVSIDPNATKLDEGIRFPICNPPALTDLFRQAGLSNVHCDGIDIPTPFADFDDFWRPLLEGTGPAAAYVASLDEERRQRLERKLKEDMGSGPSGEILLHARAWAVRGTAR